MKQPYQSNSYLMLASLLVLLLFLVFWLRGAYEDAELVMAEKGNLMYQETVRQVQDSVYGQFIQIFIENASKNGGYYEGNLPNGLGKIDINLKREEFKDTVLTFKAKGRQEPGFRKLETRWAGDSSSHHDTVIYIEKLERTSLNATPFIDAELQKEIIQRFDQRLLASDLPPNYQLERSRTEVDSTDLDFFPGSFNTFLQEKVIFKQAQWYLLRKISGQLLFSIFLFLLTGLSFWSLQSSNQRALQYTLLKNDFMSNMTHELKTPITTVSLAVEAIKGFVTSNDHTKMEEYLDISQHELGRLNLLVDRVLKLSHFENGVPTLNKEQTDLQHIVQKVVDAMTIQIEQQEGSVLVAVHGDNFVLNGDTVHLTNVLFNLLDNSLKYALEKPVIHLTLFAETDQLVLEIKDNGLGIPAKYQGKVFERFFRVPADGHQHNVKGYGLGLSYVSDIIEQHGGSIHLQSKENGGSTFKIELPR